MANMKEIVLERARYYYIHEEMRDWCEQSFGQGNYGPPRENNIWGHEVNFGYPKFYFVNDNDYVRFLFKWKCL